MNTDVKRVNVGEFHLRIHGDHSKDVDIDAILAPFQGTFTEVRRTVIEGS